MDATTSAALRAGRFPTEIVVAILCLGSFSGALMQSLVIPIQAELPQLLGTSAGNASWAVTATLLAAAVTMPVTGRLADLYGKKVVLCASAAVLAVGSLVAAVAAGCRRPAIRRRRSSRRSPADSPCSSSAALYRAWRWATSRSPSRWSVRFPRRRSKRVP